MKITIASGTEVWVNPERVTHVAANGPNRSHIFVAGWKTLDPAFGVAAPTAEVVTQLGG